MYQYNRWKRPAFPKGVILDPWKLSASRSQQLDAWFPTFGRGHETMLGALPYFHVFGLSCSMNLAVFASWNQILIPRPQPRTAAGGDSHLQTDFHAMVPTIVHRNDESSRSGQNGHELYKGSFFPAARPFPVEVIHEFQKLTGTFISEGFGMTETCPVTHTKSFQRKTEGWQYWPPPFRYQCLGSSILMMVLQTCPLANPAN